jgi:hypothetical protein
MKTRRMKTLAWMTAAVLAASGAFAGSRPLQVSITPDVSLFGRSEQIEGLALSLWGENPQTALALGLANGSTGRSAGVSLGVLNYADDYKGVQWGALNYTKGDFLGWQAGAVNYTDGYMKGLQCGAVNYAGRLTGVQLGVVNYAATAETGVQIGLVNFLPQNTWFNGLPDGLAPAMVFIDWRL